MEVMEEGNLMDRVPILLQRDLQYYQVYPITNHFFELKNTFFFVIDLNTQNFNLKGT